jgi:exosome complex RNA-binding protein Rrp4
LSYLPSTSYRGHGTYVENDEVIASLSGTIERVNKLVSVRALKARYNLDYFTSNISRSVL